MECYHLYILFLDLFLDLLDLYHKSTDYRRQIGFLNPTNQTLQSTLKLSKTTINYC